MRLSNLKHVNGGAPVKITCANCGTELGNEKASPKCPDGKVRFFCTPERGNDPQYSCFVEWSRKHH